MKKISDFTVTDVCYPAEGYALLKLSPADGAPLPEIAPGQFVNVECASSPTTFLRRPISINFVDPARNELWLLVKNAGAGTASLCASKRGDVLNLVFPLGHGFTLREGGKALLVGGGVGVAPLLHLSEALSRKGAEVTVLIGARSAKDLMLVEQLRRFGRVALSTEDGSCGERGLVTTNTVMEETYDMVYSCGPMPMMKALARICRERGMDCEVSLENTMACGIGACLCCVEDTREGNVCVCTKGPVFNIRDLKWD